MHVDDLLQRIRWLPPAKRKKLDEIVRALEMAPPPASEVGDGSAAETANAPRPPLRGLLRDLGPAPSTEVIDEARHEMWGNFPREDVR